MDRIEVKREFALSEFSQRDKPDERRCTNCGHYGFLHYPGPHGLCATTNGKSTGNTRDNICACVGWSTEERGRVEGEVDGRRSHSSFKRLWRGRLGVVRR
jgi:hypothetical protein